MNFDEQTIKEWRELKFYYQRDDNLKQWWFIGSKAGLLDFVRGLTNYANEISNKDISEHIHLGPYQYLKIITWNIPVINQNYIGGSLLDLIKLKTLIENKLSLTYAGEIFEVGEDYAIASEYSIKFFVMTDSFDPSSIEFPKPL